MLGLPRHLRQLSLDELPMASEIAAKRSDNIAVGIAHIGGMLSRVPCKGTTKRRGAQSLHVNGEACCASPFRAMGVVVEPVTVGDAHGYVVFALRAMHLDCRFQTPGKWVRAYPTKLDSRFRGNDSFAVPPVVAND